MAKADEKKRQAKELAELAKEELAKAKTDELKALATLRLQYANISAAAQEYRAKALEAEVAVRDAEEQFQKNRATLNEQVPAVLALAPGAPKVALKRTEWQKKMEELQKSAEVLEKKAAVLRERVEDLRTARDKHREHYDELYSELDKNRTNKTYRQRVFFARQVYRMAADQLDLYRTRIELIERERKHYLRSRESYGWALEKIADHIEARYFGQTARQWSLFLLGPYSHLHQCLRTSVSLQFRLPSFCCSIAVELGQYCNGRAWFPHSRPGHPCRYLVLSQSSHPVELYSQRSPLHSLLPGSALDRFSRLADIEYHQQNSRAQIRSYRDYAGRPVVAFHQACSSRSDRAVHFPLPPRSLWLESIEPPGWFLELVVWHLLLPQKTHWPTFSAPSYFSSTGHSTSETGSKLREQKALSRTLEYVPRE